MMDREGITGRVLLIMNTNPNPKRIILASSLVDFFWAGSFLLPDPASISLPHHAFTSCHNINIPATVSFASLLDVPRLQFIFLIDKERPQRNHKHTPIPFDFHSVPGQFVALYSRAYRHNSSKSTQMPRRARIHFVSLRSSLVNLPISIYGPLLERGVVSVLGLHSVGRP